MSDFYNHVDKLFRDWNYGHPKVLYGLIRSMKPQVIVEIGTYRGYSSAWMAKALQENNTGHIYTVDDFSLKQYTQNREDAIAHLYDNLERLGVRDFVTLLEGDSDSVALPDRIDFAYIDGWHGYVKCKRDFDNCAKRGAECICFDDTTQSVGPRMVVDEIRAAGEFEVMEVMRDCGLAIAMRKKPKAYITFSQELPDNPGVDLRPLTRAEQDAHFALAAQTNGVKYPPTITENVQQGL